MPAFRPFFGFSLPFELLLLVSGLHDAGAQMLQILQTPGPLSVRAGETLILNCTVTGVGGPGGVKWHKGLDRSQRPIFSQKGDSSQRGTRIVAGSNTDFSININNVGIQDAGTYYCVKYRSGSPEKEELSGRGTEVSVIVPPNVRVETSPSSPVPLNDTVTFTCNVEHFYPSDASLIWLENNTKSETAKVEPVTQNWAGTFSLKSTLDVIATEERNLSVFTCLVTHNSQPPINETVTLLIRPQAEEGEGNSNSETGLSPIAALWIGIILGKIVIAIFLFCLFWRKESTATVANKTGF